MLPIILLSLIALFHPVISQDLRIAPRMQAPNFTANAVFDDKFIKVSSNDYLDKKWVILLFYPFDFTFVCPTEIISFSEQNEEFEKINAQILAISTDSHHTHLTWTRTSRHDGGVGRLNFPLVADISKRISKSYGVLVEDEHDDMFGAALRGLFIISPSGVIRSIQINDDAVGRNVDETLRILKAFIWSDQHPGDACPASWRPGSDTIKTNPYESKEYFKNHYSA